MNLTKYRNRVLTSVFGVPVRARVALKTSQPCHVSCHVSCVRFVRRPHQPHRATSLEACVCSSTDRRNDDSPSSTIDGSRRNSRSHNFEMRMTYTSFLQRRHHRLMMSPYVLSSVRASASCPDRLKRRKRMDGARQQSNRGAASSDMIWRGDPCTYRREGGPSEPTTGRRQ